MTTTINLDLPDTHADLLTDPNVAVLTTVGPDGQPQSTAVWFLVDDDGVLKASITTDRQKYRNLERDPKATLFVLDPANPFRTVEVRATVTADARPRQVAPVEVRSPLQHPDRGARHPWHRTRRGGVHTPARRDLRVT